MAYKKVLGKNCLVTITPMTQQADGSFVEAAGQSLAARLERVSVEPLRELENRQVMDGDPNYVPVNPHITGNLEMVEQLNNKSGLVSAGAPALPYIFASYEFAKVVCVRGQQKWTYKGAIEGAPEGMERTRADSTFRMRPIDTGADNPLYESV